MIAGKVIAITGASSGIGRAAALLLAERGARLLLGARGDERLQATHRDVAEAGAEVASAAIDVSRRDDMRRLVEMAQERFGRLDVLVGNAGVMPIGPLSDLAVDDWMRMVDVNLKGVLHGIAAALPVFRDQGAGHFVHTASTAARKVVPDQAVYAATKAAVAAVSEGLRPEVADFARVTVLFPGYTDTAFASHVKDPALKRRLKQAGERLAMPPSAVAAAIAYAIDQPDEVDVGEIVVRSTAQA